MKYRVTGQNRDTGARMLLEFEADSKAGAERKASQSGMYVTAIQAVGGPSEVDAGSDYTTQRSRSRRMRLWPGVLLVIVLILAYVYWDRIAHWFHG